MGLKVLIGVIAATVLTLTLVLLIAKSGNNQLNICRVDTCKDLGQTMSQQMNLNADPCKDAYDYACGRWYRLLKPINYTVFDEMNESLQDNILSLLKSPQIRSSQSVKLSAEFYKSCIETAPYSASIWIRKELEEHFETWPVIDPEWKADEFDLNDILSQLRSTYNTNFLLSVEIIRNPKIATDYMIKIGYPETDTLYQDLKRKFGSKIESIQKAYEVAVKSEADKFIFGTALSEEQLETISGLVNFTMKLEEIYGETKAMNKTGKIVALDSLPDSGKEPKDLKVSTLLKNIFDNINVTISKGENVYLENEEMFTKLTELIGQTDAKTLSSYIGFQFVNKLSSIIMEVPNEEKARPQYCMTQTLKYYPYAVKRMYNEKFFDSSAKNKISYIIARIKKVIEKDEFFKYADRETKKRLIKKLNKIEIYIGGQDWINNRTRLEAFYQDTPDFTDKNYLQATIDTLTGVSLRSLKKLRTVVTRVDTLGDLDPLNITDTYLQEENALVLPTGLLQPPLFHFDAPFVISYGSLGSLIARDLVHAFDIEGQNYDENGIKRNWLSKRSQRLLAEKTQCFIDKYDDIIGINSLSNRTLVATIEGLEIALKAMVEEAETFREIRVPKQFQKLEKQQIFFIAYSQTWCVSDKGNEAILNTILHNSESFREAFKCRKPKTKTKSCAL